MAHVAGLDFEHEVVVSSDVVNLGYFGDFGYRLAEPFDWLAFVEDQRDVDDGDEFATEALGVKNGDVVFNNAALLQDSDPLEDAWRAEADGFGEVGVGDPPVALQDVENLDVGFVELGLHFFMRLVGSISAAGRLPSAVSRQPSAVSRWSKYDDLGTEGWDVM